MALFDQSKTVSSLLTIAGGLPGIGGQPCRIVIPRQSRRLQKIRIHVRFNVTTALAGPNFSIGMGAFFNTVTLTVSDAAGSNRRMIDTRGATLQALVRRWEQTTDRYTALSGALSGVGVANGYDIFWTIPIRYPILDDPIGYRTSLPLDENYLNADPVLELTTINNLNETGFTAGAMSVSAARITFYFDEINDAALLKAGKPLAYIPQEIKTLDADPVGNIWNIERGGWLASILWEEFTDTVRRTRGPALATPMTDSYTLRYGRRDMRQWYTEEAVADDDQWIVSPPMTAVSNYGGIEWAVSLIDLLCPRTQGHVFAGNSALNLYTDNAGDSASVIATAMNATGRVRLTTHKFFAPDLSALFGG